MLRLHMQLLSRRKHRCIGKGPTELSPCSRVSQNRTLGNYSGYSARSNYAEMPNLGHRDRGRKGETEDFHCTLTLFKKATLWNSCCADSGNVSDDRRPTIFFIQHISFLKPDSLCSYEELSVGKTFLAILQFPQLPRNFFPVEIYFRNVFA